jgi:hypothetical protein
MHALFVALVIPSTSLFLCWTELPAMRILDLELAAMRRPEMAEDDLGKWFQMTGDVRAEIERLEKRKLVYPSGCGVADSMAL